jgi:hypothetical protein
MSWIVPREHERRRFLASAGGLGTVALTALEQWSRPVVAGMPDPREPFAPRRPDHEPRARSVIFLFLVGGPSSVDTFDYKPLLQQLHGQKVPDGIRQAVEGSRHANVFHGCKEELYGSPFAFRRVGELGIEVSELFPQTAGVVDELCFIHSLQAESNNHAPASYQLHTGDVRPGKASLGSWVTYGLGTENQDLPGYVALFDVGPLGGAANYSNGFLPPAYQPTRLRDRGVPVLDLATPEPFSASRRATLDLVGRMNARHRESRTSAELEARIATYELAYRMQSSAPEAGDLSAETEATQAEYGVNDPEERTASFARKCLLARRLVERGVRFVQVYDMPDKDGWDAHGDLVGNHVPRARWTDRATAALIRDLKQRGLLDSTLVIWASEFGRTPMMQGENGRQHNAAGFTIWMAGGGVQGCQRIGATDEIGLMAVEQPIPFRNLHATILDALGLDWTALSYEVNGRQERLAGVAGTAEPIPGVLR